MSPLFHIGGENVSDAVLFTERELENSSEDPVGSSAQRGRGHPELECWALYPHCSPLPQPTTLNSNNKQWHWIPHCSLNSLAQVTHVQQHRGHDENMNTSNPLTGMQAWHQYPVPHCSLSLAKQVAQAHYKHIMRSFLKETKGPFHKVSARFFLV